MSNTPEPTREPRRRPLTAITETLNITRQRDFSGAWKFVVALVVVVVLGVVGWLWFSVARLDNSIAFTPAEAEIVQGKLAHTTAQARNILIATSDAEKLSGPSGNTLLLLRVDPTVQRAWLLWIPANMNVLVPGHGTVPIGTTLSLGGPAATIQAVKDLTGQPINQYVQLDVAAVRHLVDAVGGVWVDVPASIDATAADSSPNHNAGQMQPGAQLLDGYHALTFVRAPASLADQGYGRLANQRMLADSLVAAVGKDTGLPRSYTLLSAVAPAVKSTLNVSALRALQTELRGFGAAAVSQATIPGAWRATFITPDTAVTAKLVADMKAGRAFSQPTADLTHAAKQSATVTASKTPQQTTVTVSNGGGISGAAKQAAGALQTQGFRVSSVGNANVNVYKQTLVVYKSDRSLAQSVAQYLPPNAKIVKSFGFYSFKTDVLVIVGKDWNPANVPVVPIQTQ
jgi:LCP family protein required for cell wall assembly